MVSFLYINLTNICSCWQLCYNFKKKKHWPFNFFFDKLQWRHDIISKKIPTFYPVSLNSTKELKNLNFCSSFFQMNNFQLYFDFEGWEKEESVGDDRRVFSTDIFHLSVKWAFTHTHTHTIDLFECYLRSFHNESCSSSSTTTTTTTTVVVVVHFFAPVPIPGLTYPTHP